MAGIVYWLPTRERERHTQEEKKKKKKKKNTDGRYCRSSFNTNGSSNNASLDGGGVNKWV